MLTTSHAAPMSLLYIGALHTYIFDDDDGGDGGGYLDLKPTTYLTLTAAALCVTDSERTACRP